MLRAVDVQQILLQTTSVERIQQTQQQQSDLQQRYVAVHNSEEKKLLKEKVKESDETEKARIQREEERERKRGAARELRRADGKPHLPPGEDDPPEDGQGGRINIRV
ncbi:MAG: hypothetical protein A4E67_00728 [Syntrophaceae bacterium PtaB.Bin038]|nr:MAG: hypothetical protein A4E67_00728 [Syntrophaceae bacterium PtaB.Bin038]